MPLRPQFFPLSNLVVMLCSCISVRPEQSNQVDCQGVKHDLVQKLSGCTCFTVKCGNNVAVSLHSHFGDDSAITVQSTVQEIFQQPQIADTYTHT